MTPNPHLLYDWFIGDFAGVRLLNADITEALPLARVV